MVRDKVAEPGLKCGGKHQESHQSMGPPTYSKPLRQGTPDEGSPMPLVSCVRRLRDMLKACLIAVEADPEAKPLANSILARLKEVIAVVQSLFSLSVIVKDVIACRCHWEAEHSNLSLA